MKGCIYNLGVHLICILVSFELSCLSAALGVVFYGIYGSAWNGIIPYLRQLRCFSTIYLSNFPPEELFISKAGKQIIDWQQTCLLPSTSRGEQAKRFRDSSRFHQCSFQTCVPLPRVVVCELRLDYSHNLQNLFMAPIMYNFCVELIKCLHAV